ncbi:uncharacterized protein LOC144432374 [Styela clava]
MCCFFKFLQYLLLYYNVAILVNSLNVRRLRPGCRIEDGYHICSLTGLCQKRDGVFDDRCENARVNCTDDEFTCRGVNRCIPRMLLGTKNGCLLGKKGVITLPCRPDGKIYQYFTITAVYMFTLL